MSLRDISFILKKGQVNHGIVTIMDNGNNNSNNNKPANEKSTQAYKLFSEGKRPVQVAIELNLREGQVNKLYREFWKLKRVDKLYEIYPQIEHCLPSFLKLHKALKKRGLNPDNVDEFAYAIEIGIVKLPELQGRYQNLQGKVLGIQQQKQRLERHCQDIQRRIMELPETQDILQQSFDSLADKVNDLYTRTICI
jgi:ABC-type phosphate transport system auxiliary subunit